MLCLFLPRTRIFSTRRCLMVRWCPCQWKWWEWRQTALSAILPTWLTAHLQMKTLLRSYITAAHDNYTLHHAPLVTGLTLALSDISITLGSSENTESRISDKTCCSPAAFYRLETWKTLGGGTDTVCVAGLFHTQNTHSLSFVHLLLRAESFIQLLLDHSPEPLFSWGFKMIYRVRAKDESVLHSRRSFQLHLRNKQTNKKSTESVIEVNWPGMITRLYY